MAYVEDKNDFLQRWGQPIALAPRADGVLAMPYWQTMTLPMVLGIESPDPKLSYPFAIAIVSTVALLGPYPLTPLPLQEAGRLYFKPLTITVETKTKALQYLLYQNGEVLDRHTFEGGMILNPTESYIFDVSIDLAELRYRHG